MSSQDLFDYVVKDCGNSGLEVIRKVLGVEDADAALVLFRGYFTSTKRVDFNQQDSLEERGPVLLVFNPGKMAALHSRRHEDGIPCFDSFDCAPSYLKLDVPVEKEEARVMDQLQPMSSRSLSSVPSLQSSSFTSSATSRSFLEVDSGPQDIPESSSSSFLENIVDSACNLFGIQTSAVDTSKEDEWIPLHHAAASTDESLQQVRHSVVCIGGYKDETGKTWYFCRNSWPSCPLFLASAQCLVDANVDAA